MESNNQVQSQSPRTFIKTKQGVFSKYIFLNIIAYAYDYKLSRGKLNLLSKLTHTLLKQNGWLIWNFQKLSPPFLQLVEFISQIDSEKQPLYLQNLLEKQAICSLKNRGQLIIDINWRREPVMIKNCFQLIRYLKEKNFSSVQVNLKMNSKDFGDLFIFTHPRGQLNLDGVKIIMEKVSCDFIARLFPNLEVVNLECALNLGVNYEVLFKNSSLTYLEQLKNYSCFSIQTENIRKLLSFEGFLEQITSLKVLPQTDISCINVKIMKMFSNLQEVDLQCDNELSFKILCELLTYQNSKLRKLILREFSELQSQKEEVLSKVLPQALSQCKIRHLEIWMSDRSPNCLIPVFERLIDIDTLKLNKVDYEELVVLYGRNCRINKLCVVVSTNNKQLQKANTFPIKAKIRNLKLHYEINKINYNTLAHEKPLCGFEKWIFKTQPIALRSFKLQNLPLTNNWVQGMLNSKLQKLIFETGELAFTPFLSFLNKAKTCYFYPLQNTLEHLEIRKNFTLLEYYGKYETLFNKFPKLKFVSLHFNQIKTYAALKEILVSYLKHPNELTFRAETLSVVPGQFAEFMDTLLKALKTEGMEPFLTKKLVFQCESFNYNKQLQDLLTQIEAELEKLNSNLVIFASGYNHSLMELKHLTFGAGSYKAKIMSKC